MGRGRIRDEGLAALPGGGAQRVALNYNWWSLFVRCVDPERPREVVTSRPLLMHAVDRTVCHDGQTTVILTSTPAPAGRVQELLTNLSERVFERVAEYGGEVDPGPMLGAHLEADSDSVSETGSGGPEVFRTGNSPQRMNRILYSGCAARTSNS